MLCSYVCCQCVGMNMPPHVAVRGLLEVGSLLLSLGSQGLNLVAKAFLYSAISQAPVPCLCNQLLPSALSKLCVPLRDSRYPDTPLLHCGAAGQFSSISRTSLCRQSRLPF